MVISNSGIIGLKTCSTREKLCLVLEIQPITEIMHLVGESTAPLVDKCNSNCIPNLSLYPHASVAILPLQRSLSLQQTETITENYNQSQCTSQWTVWSPDPMDTSTTPFLHPRPKNNCERWGRKTVRSRGPGDTIPDCIS